MSKKFFFWKDDLKEKNIYKENDFFLILNFFYFLLNSCCVGQFCPVLKLYGRRPGPILFSFVQMKQERARPNIQCEGKRISEDSQPKNGQNYRPRRGGAYLWGIGPCPRTMVTSGLLSEVSGELVLRTTPGTNLITK